MSSLLGLCLLTLLITRSNALREEIRLNDEFPFRWQDPAGKTFNCEKGWEGRGAKCYKVFTFPVMWEDAQRICQSMGSTLVNTHDVTENIFIGNLVQNTTQHETWWTGFRSVKFTEKFLWSDGTSASLNLIMWDVDQPQEYEPQNVQCAHASSRTGLFPWSLTVCDDRRAFVCAMEKCLEGTMRCKNGRCVPASAVCDGQNDCGDASDESSCASLNANYCTKTMSHYQAGVITFPTEADKKNQKNADEYYCTLHLYGKPGGKIVTQFQMLAASLNHMSIFCGGPVLVKAKMIDLVVGNVLLKAGRPLKYMCHDHQMIIQVAGNMPSARDLIRIDWTMAPLDAEDGIKEVTTKRTLLASPLYDSANLTGHLNARWLLQTDPYHIITLQMEDVDLAPGQVLKVFDGRSPQALLLVKFDFWSRLGDPEAPHVFFTTGRHVYLEFTSSKPVPGGRFRLYHRAGCEAEVTAPYGVIMSPGYKRVPYPPAITCRLIIRPEEPGRVITLRFLPDLDIYAEDLLQINGVNITTYDVNITTRGVNITTEGINVTSAGPVEIYFRTVPMKTYNSTGFMATFSMGCETLKGRSMGASVGGVQPTGWEGVVQVTCGSNDFFPSASKNESDYLVTLTCLKGGKWDQDAQRLHCQNRVCGEPNPVENGYLTNTTSVLVEGKAYYKCFPGFSINSVEPALCTKQGWTRLPNCGDLTCSPLVVPSNGNVTYESGNGTTTGSVATFQCEHGFDLFGDGVIYCNVSGEWSGDPSPICRPLTCLVPDIENGDLVNVTDGQNVEKTLVPMATEVRAQCEPGYEVLDGLTICKPDRTFSKVLECIDIDECANNTSGCEHTCNNTDGNYTCSCMYGFTLAPDGHNCTARDDWCARQPCDDSCVTDSGTYYCECNLPGKELYTSVGLNGFRPTGNDTGFLPWNIPAVNHSCVDVMCPLLVPVNNSRRLTPEPSSGYHHKDEASFRCDVGYMFDKTPAVVHEVTVRCTENSTWDRPIPQCVDAMCELPDTSANPHLVASVAGNETSFGASVLYNCSVPGASPVYFERTCGYDFTDHSYKLMGDRVICNEIDCGIPSVTADKLAGIKTSLLPLAGNTKFDSSFEFVCDANSTLVGNSTTGDTNVTCQANGRWGLGSLRCLARSCRDPGYPAGGTQMNVVSYETNQEVHFQCGRPGYYPDPAVIQCTYQPSGHVDWNDTRTPLCKDGQDPEFLDCPRGVRVIRIVEAQALTDVTTRQLATDNTGIASLDSDFNLLTALYSDRNVTWTAYDFMNNSATCVWMVTVKTLVPVILDCPPFVTYELSNYTNTGLVNVPALVNATSNKVSAPVSYSPGTIVLTEQIANTGVAIDVSATDTSTNFTARCRTIINFNVDPCGPWGLIGPKNGDTNCTVVLNSTTGKVSGYECRPSCNQGYVFHSSLQPTIYTCTTGEPFSPTPSVPSCIAPAKSTFRRTPQLSYKTNIAPGCRDTKLKERLLTILNTSLILDANNGFLVGCQRRFPTYNFTILADVAVASISSTEMTASFIVILSVESATALTICGNSILEDFSFMDTAAAFSQSKEQLTTVTGIDTTGCGGCIPSSVPCYLNYVANSLVDKTPNTPKTNPKYGFECPTNMILQKNDGNFYDCVSCPPGYYTLANETCMECAHGTYQNDSAQANCITCPQGTNSVFIANPHPNRCFATCPPGYTSDNGLQPCTPCAANSYWLNSTTCSPCPSDVAQVQSMTVNPQLGSPDSSNCRFLCAPGLVSLTTRAPHCVPCPSGFYSGDLDNRTTCEACPLGKASLPGASSIASCNESCVNTTCQNNGVCVVRDNRDSCTCNPGFTGALCEVTLDPCASSPCYNQGNCTALNGIDYTCTCTLSSSEVMKLVELNADYPNHWYNSMNYTDINACQIWCLGEAGCKAIAHNPSPPGGLPVSLSCLAFSATTGQTGTHQGYTLYKKTTAISQSFNGSNCEVDPINNCDTTTCQNGGQCRDMPGYAECFCATVDIFSGEFCEEAQVVCQKFPCKNGGTCQATSSIRRDCICAPGYSGRDCEVLIDYCVAIPCHRDALCVHEVGNFTCNCTDGFTGHTCMVNPPNPCDTVRCENGQCEHDYRNNMAQCVCNEHYSFNPNNKTCTAINKCDTNPCRNGTCVRMGKTDFRCDCESGYEGGLCQHDIDECEGKPCKNGATCRQEVGNFTCHCTPRFEGELCEDMISLCNVTKPCNMTGSDSVRPCEDSPEGFQCHCKGGFRGKNCEEEIDECDSQPCLHGGACVDKVDDFSCRCLPGWTGKKCEHVEPLCSLNTCQNDAQCFNTSRQAYCHCRPGSFGQLCENSPADACANAKPCQNNGTCSESEGRASCNCTYGFEGQWCERETDFCASPSRCKHDGRCDQDKNDYTCTCKPGFTGRNCEVNIDDCIGVTCENGGVARDEVGSCRCDCGLGHAGPFCKTVWSKNFALEFSGPGHGVYEVFPLSNSFKLSYFVKYSKAGGSGCSATLYGLRNKDERLDEAAEVLCLKGERGANDGQEHYVQATWSGGNFAAVTLDSTVGSISVSSNVKYTHGVLMVGAKYNDVTTQFEGTIRTVKLWTQQNGAEHQVIGTKPPQLSGAVRLNIGFQPAPSTKVFPTLKPGGCPSDTAVTAGTEVSVLAAIPEPKFDPSTFTAATTNYASGLPRQPGVYNILTVAEKADAYGTCSFNMYVRYGDCASPDGANCTIDGPDGLYKGCTTHCAPGRTFLYPAPKLHTCGPLGVFRRSQPRTPFSLPPCGVKQVRPAQDVILKVQYNIRNEKEGVTSGPVLTTLKSILTAAITGANSVMTENQGQSMCHGACDISITATNTQKELTTVTIKLANVTMYVGPRATWPLEQFLKQQVLQDRIFDATPNPSKGKDGFTLPDTGPRDISGRMDFSIDVRPHCAKPYQVIGDDCVKCTAGNYYNVTTEVCEHCPVGEYNTEDGVESCTHCGNLKTTLREGANNPADCVDICLPGTRFNRTDNSCVPCGQGAYQPKSGRGMCINCGLGETTILLNATSKSDCIAQCAPGEYQNLQNTCELCRQGLYRSLKDKTCQQCPRSTTTSKKGATSPSACTIKLCVAGQYNDNNTCVPCDINTYSTSRDTAMCTPCGTGNETRTTGADAPERCEMVCENGTFINVNTSQCMPCPPNTYKVNSHSAKFLEACTACPNGLRTEGGQKTNLTDCKFPVCSKGEFVNPIFVDDPTSGMTPCLKCNISSYQPFQDPLNRTCLPCPDLTRTVGNGAVALSQCIPLNVTRVSATMKLQGVCTDVLLQPMSQAHKDLVSKLQDPSAPDSLINQVKGSLGAKGDNVKGIDVKGFECGSISVNFDILYVRESQKGQTVTTPELNQAVAALAKRSTLIAGLPSIPNTVIIIPKDTVSCAAGQGLNKTTGVAVCEDCPVGTYQYTDIKETCLPCALTFTTVGPKRVWDFAAQPTKNPCKKICDAGSDSPDNLSCMKCAAGKFKKDDGIEDCIPCGANLVTLDKGATSRDQCIAKCDPGQFSTTNNVTSQKECQECARGYYSIARNSLTCVKCEDMYTTKGKGTDKKEDCVDLCVAGGYCYNGATCRFDRTSKKHYCDCRIPYKGDRCQTRGEVPSITQTGVIIVAVFGAFGGIALISFAIFGVCVLIKRNREKSPRQSKRVHRSSYSLKEPIIYSTEEPVIYAAHNPVIYASKDPVYATTIGPTYYHPMGISGDRRYPLVPGVTSRSISDYNASLTPAIAHEAYVHGPSMVAPPPSQYMFYEDPEDNGSRRRVYERGLPRIRGSAYPTHAYYN